MRGQADDYRISYSGLSISFAPFTVQIVAASIEYAFKLASDKNCIDELSQPAQRHGVEHDVFKHYSVLCFR